MKLQVEYTYKDGSKVRVGYRECDELTVYYLDETKVASMKITQREDLLTEIEPTWTKAALTSPDKIYDARCAKPPQEEKKPSILDINRLFG